MKLGYASNHAACAAARTVRLHVRAGGNILDFQGLREGGQILQRQLLGAVAAAQQQALRQCRAPGGRAQLLMRISQPQEQVPGNLGSRRDSIQVLTRISQPQEHVTGPLDCGAGLIKSSIYRAQEGLNTGFKAGINTGFNAGLSKGMEATSPNADPSWVAAPCDKTLFCGTHVPP